MIVYSQPGQSLSDPELSMAAISRVHAVVEFMRGNAALMPAGATRLVGGAPSMRHGGVSETVFLLNIRDHLNVITAMPIREAGAPTSPFVLTVRTIDQNVLSGIAERLQLADLRMIEADADPAGENSLSIHRRRQPDDCEVRVGIAQARRRNPDARSSRSSASRWRASRCSRAW